MKGSRPRLFGRVFINLQLRQAPQKHVDLENASLVDCLRLIFFAGIFRQDVASEIHQQEFCTDSLRFSIDLKLHHPLGQVDVPETCPGYELGARASGRSLELARNRSHSTNWDFPFAGLVADQVIKKAAVLEERRVVRMGENADFT